MCLPGEYQSSCGDCKPCPGGTYTSGPNREPSCHYCFRDCRSGYHLEVVQNCTSTTNVRCRCEAGFRCTDTDTLTQNCKYCEKIRVTTTTVAPAVTSGRINQTQASSGHSSTSTTSCHSPNCGSPLVAPGRNATSRNNDFPLSLSLSDKTSKELAAILCPVVAIGCIALVILFYVRRPGDETCFKLAIVKLCNEGGRDASSHKAKEPTHQYPRDPSSPLAAATLGQVHVHNPGTVIFSLLSQFTGQADPTARQGEKTRKAASNEEEEEEEEEEERDCPVFHPTPSPSVHLSEEERNGEVDRVFFPSQEQGKDCHMSKEEAL
uniref:uncharacterized protein isoform X1 n=1 Tax=Centroberyx gerrardi TaxID=166262 RepID=UPI003AAD9297